MLLDHLIFFSPFFFLYNVLCVCVCPCEKERDCV